MNPGVWFALTSRAASHVDGAQLFRDLPRNEVLNAHGIDAAVTRM